MYRTHFGLKVDPFALTPDPRFLYLSPRHREALAHLLYGMGEAGGFVQLTGEVGTGKTTLCRSLLEQAPDDVDVALIFNPRQTPAELVASVCDEFHVPYPAGTASLKVLTDGLNRHLLEGHAKGRRSVLVIDEAQNLSAEALEQVRLLTNLETTTRKLLQILLIGQPELRGLMARPELRQLDQRVTARYHLAPLSGEETAQYVRHRLEVAGAVQPIFSAGALRRVHRLSGGVPRLVNILCDRALLGAYARGRHRVGRALVRHAGAEVRGQLPGARRRALAWACAAAVCVVGGAAGWLAVFPSETLPPTAGSEVFGRPGEPAGPPHAASAAAAEQPPATVPVLQAPEAAPPEVVPRDGVNAAPSAVPAALGDRLAGAELRTDTEAAFDTLFGYWGIAYGGLAGATACERAAAAGLRCHYGRGNWTSLAFFNLPAVLELRGPDGVRHQAVVVGLDETQVTLDFGGERVSLPRGEVESLWFGDFLLLWEPPPQGSRLLRLGSEGADVLWLRARLDRAEGRTARPAVPPDPRFREDLRDRVKAFQEAHGLRPDGIAGEQTFIQLSAAASTSPVPALRNL